MTFSRRVNFVNCIPPWIRIKLRKKKWFSLFTSKRQLSIVYSHLDTFRISPYLSPYSVSQSEENTWRSIQLERIIIFSFARLFIHIQSDVERQHGVSIFDMDSIRLKLIKCILSGTNERNNLLIHIKFWNIDYEFSFK